MVFYSGKLITAAEMQNSTIVVITDRNDLDDQVADEVWTTEFNREN